MEHRSSTVFLHCSLSWACRSIWVHRRPICCSSCSFDLLQLFFGLPQFRFPWRFQKSVCLVKLLSGFLNVCPIHFHFFLLTWVVIFSSWVFASSLGLRCWWCSTILPQGCYVGSDSWRLGSLLRFSSLQFCAGQFTRPLKNWHPVSFSVCLANPPSLPHKNTKSRSRS